MNFDDWRERKLQDPEFRAAYEKYGRSMGFRWLNFRLHVAVWFRDLMRRVRWSIVSRRIRRYLRRMD